MGVKLIASTAEFDETVANAAGLVVIDFYADWCGPCKMIAPKVEAMSAEETSVTFIKVNVDDLDEVAQKCGISAMPTFKFYKGGKEVDELVGASEEKLKALVAKNK